MENRIHQVVKLDSGENFVILRQVVYKMENYYIAAKLDCDGLPLKHEIMFFHQITVNEQLKFEEVKDTNLMNYLYTYMKI